MGEPPREILYTDRTGPPLEARDLVRIAEIFETPLTVAYQWDYASADTKIERLYRLGKELNWNAAVDVDWSPTLAKAEPPIDEAVNPFVDYPPFDALDAAARVEFAWHVHAWTLSQFLHGEQGALLVASQLVSCAPTVDAKLYAGSQTFDEARHVEAFGRYVREKIGFMYPVDPYLKALLDKVLTDPRWDLKFVGMQLIIEGLALAAFQTLKMVTRDPLCRDILERVIRDESRHVAFGVVYLEEFLKALPPQEVAVRAEFAYEACAVMRERLVPTRVFAHYGWDEEASRRRYLDSPVLGAFQKMLFQRVMPNLKKVGLLPEGLRPRYEALGILSFENLVHDGEIDWAALGAPPAPRGDRPR